MPDTGALNAYPKFSAVICADWGKVRLATELGLSRRFDDISTTWKGPQHIGAENVLL